MDPQGDQAVSFLKNLRPLQGVLERYCRRMLRDRSQVEDVLQSAVAQAYVRFTDFIPGTNFKAWIFRFVTLEIFNLNRKHSPAPFADCQEDMLLVTGHVAVQEESLESLLRSPEVVYDLLEEEVADALQQLTLPERTTFLLRSLGEFSYQEIHEQLAIPLGSVIGYLSRARAKLRKSLSVYAERRGLVRPHPAPGEVSP